MKQAQRTGVDIEAGLKHASCFNILIELQGIRHMMSADEIATLLQRSVFTIYRMANRGQIPFIRIGGSKMFDPSVIAMWLTKKDPTLAIAARQLAKAA